MSKTALTSSIKLEVAASQECELPSGHKATCVYGRQLRSQNLLDGFFAGKANQVWESTVRHLADGHAEDIDLRRFSNVDMGRGLGNDGLGQAILMDEVVLLLILHAGGEGDIVLMPKDKSHEQAVNWIASETYVGKNGSILYFNPDEDAYQVFDSRRMLTIAARNGDASYDITVLGRRIDREETKTTTPV